MPGLTVAIYAEAAAVAALALALCWLLAHPGTDRPAFTGQPDENRPQQGRSATLTVELPQTWTLAHAGLTGPSAWLTAPRETAGFTDRRAAIGVQYARAERRQTAALRRAGMTKKAGWTCE